MAEHGPTPTPWVADYDDNGFFAVLPTNAQGPSPYIVATGGEGDEDRANAVLIVRAVNSHAAMVDALKGVIAQYDAWTGHNDDGLDLTAARAALALAEAAQ